MRVETNLQGNRMVVRLTGRLDAAWSEHLLGMVRDIVREGHHQVLLDAAGLEYLSSAGIRALLKIRRELQAVNGTFGIVQAATFVQDTLRMSGLETLLQAAPESAGPAADTATAGESAGANLSALPGMRVEHHVLDPAGTVTVRVHAGWRPWQVLAAGAAQELAFPRPRFGLGIGAAGRDAADGGTRLGEFVAADGAVAWLPTDGADQPDYLEQTEQFVPRLHAIQAIVGEGTFAHLLRFRPETKGMILSAAELFELALGTAQAEAVAVVALVEVEGLVGVALARSPGQIQASDQPGQFPEVRDWLSFCGERVHRQSQALLVAFVCRGSAHALAPHLTPLPSRPGILAHAHAVVLPFRQLPQGVLDLGTSVQAVFEDSAPLGLLHLIEDDRPALGLGQSSFIRGACWCAPVQFSRERPS
ncbi:MAG: STAS domain-containing protein [Lentisphaeria bacterium]|jgi:anti-anti-sigma factor|nr:STAS domain-containing protein [Lentisphaeria bacterium]